MPVPPSGAASGVGGGGVIGGPDGTDEVIE